MPALDLDGTVLLNPSDMAEAEKWARRVHERAGKLKARPGAGAGHTLKEHHIGMLGELAFHYYRGVPTHWTPEIESVDASDVDGFEVRTTTWQNGRLLLRPGYLASMEPGLFHGEHSAPAEDRKLVRPFVLVVGVVANPSADIPGRLRVVGFCLPAVTLAADEAHKWRNDGGWIDQPDPRRPIAVCIPQGALTPFLPADEGSARRHLMPQEVSAIIIGLRVTADGVVSGHTPSGRALTPEPAGGAQPADNDVRAMIDSLRVKLAKPAPPELRSLNGATAAPMSQLIPAEASPSVEPGQAGQEQARPASEREVARLVAMENINRLLGGRS